MKSYYPAPLIIGIFITLILAGCAPEATPPTVDVIGTISVQLASDMMTQTASAHSPTPQPITPTLLPTETMTPEPVRDQSIRTVVVITNAPCWFGPGSAYPLESYISETKIVEVLGVGSVEGWYIIHNPYFNQPCWIAASDVQIDPAMDSSIFPVMTPGH